MPAGKFDQRIKIQVETLAADGMGGGASSWADVGNVTMAQIVAQGGGEVSAADQVQERKRYSVTIHNRRDILAKHRVLWLDAGNKVLNIRDTGDLGRQPLERTLICEDAPQ